MAQNDDWSEGSATTTDEHDRHSGYARPHRQSYQRFKTAIMSTRSVRRAEGALQLHGSANVGVFKD